MFPIITDKFKRNTDAFLTGLLVGIMIMYFYSRLDIIYLLEKINKKDIVITVLVQQINQLTNKKENTMKFDELINKLNTEIVEEKDPKAAVRNKINPVFPADSKNVKDDKDHFPLEDEDQARNALARANQYDKAPDWFDGSLTELKKKVADTVKREFPNIEISEESYK
jgi:hypothetical protein